MKNLGIFILSFLMGTSSLTAQCPNFSRPGVHVVQSGENLFRVSKRYGISYVELAAWNKMATTSTLYPCQELKITRPNRYNQAASPDYFVERSPYNTVASPNVQTYQKQTGKSHVIQAGETIEGIAALYGYTEERFRKFNILKPHEELSVGSSVLISDCACDRVVTHEAINKTVNTTKAQNTRIISISNPNHTANETFQERGLDEDYDPFYDDPAYNENPNTPPPAVYIGDGIRSVSSPTAYNATTRKIETNNARPTYMTNEELIMLDEINLLRSNPTGYIAYVEQYKRDLLSGKSFGSSIEVCDELIEELKQTPPLSILNPLPCLYAAAKNHGLDQKARGETGHEGTDGSWPWDRVRGSCTQLADGNENLVGGPSAVREAVMLLLVDDGIPNRGHRKTLLHKDWKYAAAYKIGKVGYMPNCWVQKFGY